MNELKRALCWLFGHAVEKHEPGTEEDVKLCCHHIDGTFSTRIVRAHVIAVSCSRCGVALPDDVVFLTRRRGDTFASIQTQAAP